jgi:hypothetical protein
MCCAGVLCCCAALQWELAGRLPANPQHTCECWCAGAEHPFENRTKKTAAVM